jgi:phospholipid/cholesterol/gamma-HCH transport system substrate-binding protein
MARKRSHETKYNETFFRGMGGPGPTAVGLFVILLIVVGLYLAFTKQLPFTGPGYEVKATFANAVRISDKAPVRIAGVNVGEVTGLERQGNASVVSFTVTDEGRPIHEDALVRIRPRIFLEGNFFLDVDPGSPSAPELPDGGQIPLSRTSTAVQLDEVLTALQQPQRENLQLLLEGLGTAFTYRPTPDDDVDQDPDVQGETAATALNQSFDTGGEAGRTSAIVNEAFLGSQPDRDIQRLLIGGSRAAKALVSRETQLKDLVTNFNTTVSAFADESQNLSETIRLLAPTLETAQRSFVSLNEALPPLRALSIATEPGIAELPETIAAGLPWIEQSRELLGADELGGIAALLERGTPASAAAMAETVAGLPELTDFNRCIDENLIPAGNVELEDSFGPHDFSTGQPNYREFFYAASGLAAESANFDGNGIYVRFQPGGGPHLVKVDNPGGAFEAEAMYGQTIAPPLGTRPRLTGMPPMRPNVDCHSNSLPNLNGPAADAGPPSPAVVTP